MKECFLNKIKEDLEKSGFGAELKARNVFKGKACPSGYAIWEVAAGNSYQDKDKNISREIDICATTQYAVVNNGSTSLFYTCLCEVKKVKQPWIVFKDKEISRGRISNAFSKSIGASDMYSIVRSSNNLPSYLGYSGSGIHEAFKNPDQPSKWYAACLSAIKAAISEYDVEVRDVQSESIEDFNATICMHQPVVIIDGTLLSAELSTEDEMIIEKEKYVSIFVDYSSSFYVGATHQVDIVALEYLDEYLDLASGRASDIKENLYQFLKQKGASVKPYENS